MSTAAAHRQVDWSNGSLAPYVARGWAFTPLAGKVPIRKGWQSEPAIPLAELQGYGGNIGLRTGAASGIVVVDVDDLEALEPLAERLPVTVEVVTGSGKRHLYYAYDKPLPNSAGKLAPGIDIRADGGQVVFVGSIHPESGRPYRWAPGLSPDEIEIARLPEWVVEALTPKTAPAPAPRPANGNGRGGYVAAALAGECETVQTAGEGERNHTLNNAAFALGQLVGGGHLERWAVESELLTAALACGLPEFEARRTIKSGLDSGIEQPREIPERDGGRAYGWSDEIGGESRSKGQSTPAGGRHTLSNFVWVRGEDGKPKKEGQPLTDVSRNLFSITNGWPKRIGNLLFYDDAGMIRFLETSESFFAWIGERCDLQWGSGSGVGNCQLTPKSEFHAHLQYAAQSFEAVESLPHRPEIPTSYYSWRAPSGYTPKGERLAELLRFFDNAETPADRILIKAAILTPAWGGLPGTRPAFAITAPDRGCGKTTLSEAVGELYAGIVEIEPHGDEARIVSRLLAPDSLLTRIASVDNIKGGLSSALLESLITKAVISGHRLYHGEAKRQNTITWILTANCLRLSRDLSDRCFFIRLRKPIPIPDWRERLFTFIQEHRQEIIADIVNALEQPACRHSARDRWQGWTDSVLARVTDDPAPVVELNQRRRDEYDDDLEQASDIWDALKDEPSGYADGFLPSARVLELVNKALGVNWTAKKIAVVMAGHIEAGRLPNIERGRKMSSKGYYVSHNSQNAQVEP